MHLILIAIIVITLLALSYYNLKLALMILGVAIVLAAIYLTQHWYWR